MLSRTVFAAAIAFGCFTPGLASQASADDTTTTTTTTEHHENGLGAVITAPARAAGAVVEGVVGGQPEGCTHKSVTKTNEDTGDTVTKSRTDCD